MNTVMVQAPPGALSAMPDACVVFDPAGAITVPTQFVLSPFGAEISKPALIFQCECSRRRAPRLSNLAVEFFQFPFEAKLQIIRWSGPLN
jgi:hypothetical protein